MKCKRVDYGRPSVICVGFPRFTKSIFFESSINKNLFYETFVVRCERFKPIGRPLQALERIFG